MQISETLDNRRTGRTTKQMAAAEPGALFVWCTSDLHYPRDLAKRLKRADLQIVSSHALKHDGEQLRGRRYPQIVVDHAFDGYIPDIVVCASERPTVRV